MVSFDGVDQLAAKKTSRGKQRIDIKKIEMKSKRQVTLSKRRKGLFKKCTELSTSSGSQFAAITFSLAGKPCSAGFPCPDAVIQRFLSDSGTDFSGSQGQSPGVNYWWETPIEDMGLMELEKFKIALQGLRNKVLSRVELIALETELVRDIDDSDFMSIISQLANVASY